MAFETVVRSASGAKTVSGQTGAVPVMASWVGVGVDCTAVSGTTPTLDVSLQWSFDGVNFSAGESPVTFAQITAAKSTHVLVQARAPYMRVMWTVGGTTPSFTFAVNTFTY
jgi:hypothetical protein